MTIDRKVQYGSTVTALTGLATWLLVTYAFHGSIPPDLANALPVLIATVLGAVSAYWTKHAPKDLVRGVDVVKSDVRVSQMALGVLSAHAPTAVGTGGSSAPVAGNSGSCGGCGGGGAAPFPPIPTAAMPARTEPASEVEKL